MVVPLRTTTRSLPYSSIRRQKVERPIVPSSQNGLLAWLLIYGPFYVILKDYSSVLEDLGYITLEHHYIWEIFYNMRTHLLHYLYYLY